MGRKYSAKSLLVSDEHSVFPVERSRVGISSLSGETANYINASYIMVSQRATGETDCKLMLSEPKQWSA